MTERDFDKVFAKATLQDPQFWNDPRCVSDKALVFTWCVCPAGVHRGEVDFFVLRGPSLRQYHLLSLHGARP